MTHPCQRSNPLIRGGTDQNTRRLDALSADHFKVDERTIADFILFARRYARNVRYYGNGATDTTSWERFFEQDISVNLATLATLPLQRFIDFKDALRAFLEQGETLGVPTRNEYFALLLRLPLLLLHEISQSAARLPRNETTVRLLDNWAGRELGADSLLLKSYVLGAVAAPLQGFTDQPLNRALLNIDPDAVSSLLLVPEQVEQRFIEQSWADLANAVYLGFTTLFPVDLAAVVADPTPYQQASTHHDQVYDALNYNLLIGAIEKLLSSIQAVITLAQQALEQALTRDDHTPHYGLWLVFLRLYQEPQQLLNKFTGRHLDFYYRDVLKLKLLPEQADQVALVLELAKPHNEYLLKTGTLFNGGKDSAGIPRHYALTRDTVINRAQIAGIKSFRVHNDGTKSTPYAALQTNSADGIGGKLAKNDPQWPAFGPLHASSLCSVGFAIADPKLRLSDGTRVITVKANFVSPLPATIQNVFGAALTLEKEWLTLSGTQFAVSKSGNQLIFTLTLASDLPAVLPYSADVHGFNFTTTEPVLRIWLKPESGRFNDWSNTQVSQLTLAATVSGSRNFSLSNDFGTLDPAKPFMPYGAQPKVNGQFVLGSREVFCKPLANIALHPQWQEVMDGTNFFYKNPTAFSGQVRAEYLFAGKWQQTTDELVPFFFHASTQDQKQFLAQLLFLIIFYYPQLLNDPETAALARYFFNALIGRGLVVEGVNTVGNFDVLTDRYSNSSISGFVRFTLLNNFGHQQYPQENTLALLSVFPGDPAHPAKTGINYDGAAGPPKLPYTPTITALTLDYATTENTPQTLLHVYPFGSAKVSGVNAPLLPPLRNEGELYLALTAADPPQLVSLLFAAVEGSSNPLKNIATLQWHYLQQDTWVEIPATAISDSSSSLSGSGIIAFELPAEADTTHNILPGDLRWLRLSVAEDTDAVCNLLGIYTQAALAIGVDNNNADDALAKPLPAGAISKLLIPNTSVKKIQQPLPSFAGKPAELDTDFYQRVSERLRHKNRAVTIWDYEHLVLQQFPQVFKVRCLNHTALCRDGGDLVLAENGLHPGAVLVVPIPLLQANTASDPHRPYNTTKTLADIDTFLRTRISPFVKLEVVNPQIEEVQLKFKVAFTDDIVDTGFYLSLLNQELNQYLMPWAYARGGQVDFGGKWYKSVLINFIEERPYVDFVKDVQMFHRVDILSTSTQWQLADREVIRASAARSILVSHPLHQITALSEVTA